MTFDSAWLGEIPVNGDNAYGAAFLTACDNGEVLASRALRNDPWTVRVDSAQFCYHVLVCDPASGGCLEGGELWLDAWMAGNHSLANFRAKPDSNCVLSTSQTSLTPTIVFSGSLWLAFGSSDPFVILPDTTARTVQLADAAARAAVHRADGVVNRTLLECRFQVRVSEDEVDLCATFGDECSASEDRDDEDWTYVVTVTGEACSGGRVPPPLTEKTGVEVSAWSIALVVVLEGGEAAGLQKSIVDAVSHALAAITVQLRYTSEVSTGAVPSVVYGTTTPNSTLCNQPVVTCNGAARRLVQGDRVNFTLSTPTSEFPVDDVDIWEYEFQGDAAATVVLLTTIADLGITIDVVSVVIVVGPNASGDDLNAAVNALGASLRDVVEELADVAVEIEDGSGDDVAITFRKDVEVWARYERYGVSRWYECAELMAIFQEGCGGVAGNTLFEHSFSEHFPSLNVTRVGCNDVACASESTSTDWVLAMSAAAAVAAVAVGVGVVWFRRRRAALAPEAQPAPSPLRPTPSVFGLSRLEGTLTRSRERER